MRKAAGLVARSKSARARSTDNASTEQEATGEGAVESVMVRNGRGHGEAARGDSFAIGAELAFWSQGSLTRKKAFAQSDIGLRGRAAAGPPCGKWRAIRVVLRTRSKFAPFHGSCSWRGFCARKKSESRALSRGLGP